MNPIQALRRWLATQQLDAFLLTRSDRYLNEDLAPCDEYLHWLTGFSGSVGQAIITQDKAALFVDGRYTLQAAQQVGNDIEVRDDNPDTVKLWISKHLHTGAILSLDGERHSITEMDSLAEMAATGGQQIRLLQRSPLAELWLQRPPEPCSTIYPHPTRYTGLSSEQKCQQLAGDIRNTGCDALLIPAPDMVAWLLNVRGQDIEIAPLPFSTALLYSDGSVEWFVDEERLHDKGQWLPCHIKLSPPQKWPTASYPLRKLWLDPALTPAATAEALPDSIEQYRAPHPLPPLRACKNSTEIAGMRDAHRQDGLALCQFLQHWQQQHLLDEQAVVDQLAYWRQQQPDYRGISFETIAATGANGAQPHYLPDPRQSAPLQAGQLLLIDSGGQYNGGTTDITRVLPVSRATQRQRMLYTTVLKGHIALASSQFPVGTCGQQLDALARQPLWQQGLDYDHGTGHGVGAYLHVHEGPHRIAKQASTVPLQPGMVTSIEPGVYLPEELGIRIENLYAIAPAANPGFLCFEALTLVPLEPALIDQSLLTTQEQQWLDNYHAHIWQQLAALLPDDTAHWLREQIQAICPTLAL